MRTLIIIVSVLFLSLYSCRDMTEGYLITENAGYNPDSLIVLKNVPESEYITISNPAYEAGIDAGKTPQELEQNGIFPTIQKENEYYVRVKNNSPWQTLYLQGYEGTEPITFEVEAVTSTAGDEAARVFKNELIIRGKGYMSYPLKNNAVPGKYHVSIRLTNAGYSQVVTNVFTFIVIE
ncbi:hypothetical protein [Butyricimonas synergistica]|uniref:hypothetical protein n=1 Tax=Butyricimonas synergistica TaxID=544644 RepID=UPI0003745BEB|nr:hypothetical protein [Butyricimonas synergistica]